MESEQIATDESNFSEKKTFFSIKRERAGEKKEETALSRK